MNKKRNVGLVLLMLLMAIVIPNLVVRPMIMSGRMMGGSEPAKPPDEVKDEPLTPEAEAKIKELIPKLSSEDWPTREDAVQELIKMGKMVIPFAIELLQSTDPEVRMRATQILNATGGWIRVPALAEERIKNMLNEIDTRDLRLEDIHSWSLRYGGELNLYQLEHVTRKLYYTIKPVGSEIIPALVKNLDKATDPKMKAVLVYLVGKFPSKDASDSVLKLTRDDNQAVKYLAVDTLGKLKDETVVPKLINLAQDKDENTKLLAYGSLSNYSTRESAKFLINGLSDNNAEIRLNSFYGLWKTSSGQSFGYNPYDAGERQKLAIGRWAKWAEEELGKPLPPKPLTVNGYLCFRDIQQIIKSYEELPFWKEDKKLKKMVEQLEEQYLSQYAQQIKIKPEVLKQLQKGITDIHVAYYKISEIELRAGEGFRKQVVPIIAVQIGLSKPNEVKQLLDGPLQKFVMLKEKYQGKEVLCIKPGIWAYVDENGLSACPDKEILKGVIDAGGLTKKMEEDDYYQMAKSRLARDNYFWGYVRPAELAASFISDSNSMGRMGFKHYLGIESALDLTNIKLYGFGVTVKDDHLLGNDVVYVNPEHRLYQILASAPATQKDLLKVLPAEQIFTVSWSFTKDPVKLWEEIFKYGMNMAPTFDPHPESEEKIIREMTEKFGSSPAEVFGQIKNGATFFVLRPDSDWLGFTFAVKDTDKTKEIVKKFDKGQFASSEKKYKGITYFYGDGAYTFIENNFIFFPKGNQEIMETFIDTYKSGKTLDKWLEGREKEGWKPELSNSSFLLIFKPSALGEVLYFDELGPVMKEIGVDENTAIIGSVSVDKSEISFSYWSNLKISGLIHGGLKFAVKQMGGGEIPPDEEEEEEK